MSYFKRGPSRAVGNTVKHIEFMLMNEVGNNPHKLNNKKQQQKSEKQQHHHMCVRTSRCVCFEIERATAMSHNTRVKQAVYHHLPIIIQSGSVLNRVSHCYARETTYSGAPCVLKGLCPLDWFTCTPWGSCGPVDTTPVKSTLSPIKQGSCGKCEVSPMDAEERDAACTTRLF